MRDPSEKDFSEEDTNAKLHDLAFRQVYNRELGLPQGTLFLRTHPLLEMTDENLSDRPESQTMTFGKELEALLNRHSIESGSNTPDFILATYVQQCLAAWNLTVAAREKWYGREFTPGTIDNSVRQPMVEGK